MAFEEYRAIARNLEKIDSILNITLAEINSRHKADQKNRGC